MFDIIFCVLFCVLLFGASYLSELKFCDRCGGKCIFIGAIPGKPEYYTTVHQCKECGKVFNHIGPYMGVDS